MDDVLGTEKVIRIWALNDAFRSTFHGGKVVKTVNVAELGDEMQAL